MARALSHCAFKSQQYQLIIIDQWFVLINTAQLQCYLCALLENSITGKIKYTKFTSHDTKKSYVKCRCLLHSMISQSIDKLVRCEPHHGGEPERVEYSACYARSVHRGAWLYRAA